MGENLRRLFAESKQTKGNDYLRAAKRRYKLDLLLQAHGEALIEALERLHRDSTASDFNEHWESYANATQLLAQLEQEAQP